MDSRTYFHSDDLGATQNVSENILEAWKIGGIQGFSILANGMAIPFVKEALIKESSRQAEISVHLNLSEGKSLIPREEVPYLVDKDGVFKHSFGSLLLFWFTSSKDRRKRFLEQVSKEWQAQILRVKDTCAPRDIKCLDGHQHIHMLWFLFNIAAELGRKSGIPEIRISREYFYFSDFWKDAFSPFFLMNVVKFLVLRILCKHATSRAIQEGLRFKSALVGVLFTGHMNRRRAERGIRAAKKSVQGRIEILFHVGRATQLESLCWSNPDFAKFYTSPLREMELQEIRELASLNPRTRRSASAPLHVFDL